MVAEITDFPVYCPHDYILEINSSPLPKVEAAVVPTEKVRDYLLDLGHPVGGDKAKFFIHFGFQRERWEELAEA